MTRRVVCDASAVVSALLDAGADGQWAAQRLMGADLYAPAILPFECANVIRRHELSGLITADYGAQAHMDLLDLAVELWPYHTVAERVWRLRANVTAYDGAYAALAETLSVPLVTLDRRLARVPVLGCLVETPD
jgi:predicted nucleic acid-binding protein